MAAHTRHVVSVPGEIRSQVKFRRTDLLLRHDGPLTDPYADERRRNAKSRGLDPGLLVCEVSRLPIETENGNLVGPNVIDMLERRLWKWDQLPADTRDAFLTALRDGAAQPKTLMAWSVRDLTGLWPDPTRLPCEPPDDGGEPVLPDHPFSHALVSGGSPADDAAPDGWVRVRKQSTCQITEFVHRLAVGLFGGVDEAYTRIAQAAVSAWETDQERALSLWHRVKAAPGRVLVEDAALSRLRPVCSISQEVERAILLEACRQSGVDPAMDISRRRGRPKKSEQASDQGRFIRVSVMPDGTVQGQFISGFNGVAAGTGLHMLPLHVLVSVLGALRTGGHDTDGDMLAAWLDAAEPDWETKVSDEGASGGGMSDPYEILGVQRDAGMEEITAAFRKAMKAVHPDLSGGASAWLSRTVLSAYRQICAGRAQETAA